MIKWNSLRFLFTKKLLGSSIAIFFFGHLILINGWVELIFPNLLRPSESPTWFTKLTNTATGKIILLYFSSVFLSLSVLIARLFSSDIMKCYSSAREFVSTSEAFFQKNPTSKALIENEWNILEKFSRKRQRSLHNMYAQIDPEIGDDCVITAQKEAIMKNLYEMKDKGNFVPWIAGLMFLFSVIIAAYLSLSVFVRVCAAALAILSA